MTQQEKTGVIVKGLGGLYYAMDDSGTIHVLRAKGAFRRQGITPTIGDRIRYSPGKGEADGWIEEILPRDNCLVRPPVANIRHLLFVLAPEPEPDLMLLDAMLVMAREQRIDPVLVVNKCELNPSLADLLREQYAHAEIPVAEVSAVTGQGLSSLQSVLREGICCFAGQSGVGKSTLVSALTGLSLESGEISPKTAHGRHTTRRAELLIKDGYRVLDTAGFSLLTLWESMDPIRLKEYYPDFAPYEGDCRFQPCYHQSEPGCAVLAAVEHGELSAARVERYHQLLDRVRQAWRNRYE